MLTIISLILGLVGPRVLNYLGESRVKTAKLQIENFGSALDLFYLDAGRYPTTAEGLERPRSAADRHPGLERTLSQGRKAARRPWGNPYQYRSPVERIPYEIVSFGADGREGGTGNGGRPFEPRALTRNAGFTLIETMAVMAIVALVASIAVTHDQRDRARTAQGAGPRDRGSPAARAAQRLAHRAGREVSIDGEAARSSATAASRVAIPRTSSSTSSAPTAARAGRRLVVRFEPDGSSSGAALRLSRDARRLRDPGQLVHRRGRRSLSPELRGAAAPASRWSRRSSRWR